MKKEFFIIFVLLTSLVIAQENIELIPSEERLDVNYHSFGGQYTIDLKKYLGDGPYTVSKTKNVIVDINQKTGKAIITPSLGWQGSEIIRFVLNKTKAIITLPKETFREIEIGKIVIFQDVFDRVVEDIKKENIKKLESGFRDNKLFISINDEVNLFAGYDKDLKPEFTFDILLANKGVEVQYGLLEGINLPLIILILIGIILVYIFRDMIISIVRVEKDKKNIKKIFLSKLSRYKEDEEKILDLTEAFFEKFLNIKKDSSLYLLDLALEKRDIKGDLKQEVIDLFKHLNKDKHDKDEIAHMYNSLRRILIKL